MKVRDLMTIFIRHDLRNTNSGLEVELYLNTLGDLYEFATEFDVERTNGKTVIDQAREYMIRELPSIHSGTVHIRLGSLIIFSFNL
jgi:hypothetical protein